MFSVAAVFRFMLRSAFKCSSCSAWLSVAELVMLKFVAMFCCR